MKFKLAILSLLTAITTSVSAFEIDTEACAGVEHITDLSGEVVPYDPTIHTFVTEDTPVFYAGEKTVSHIWLSHVRGAFIFVTNTASSNVSFFFKPTYYLHSTGDVISGSFTSISASFNSSNDPRSSAGADLMGGKLGKIGIAGNSTNRFATAKILWDSAVCFNKPPLTTSIEHYWYRSSVGTGISIEHIDWE